ncbi:antibiotic biosynthesis monooxygenase family protein [Nonomuraea rhodomycinica]|uniref:Antibiotic biosynthesis monooxygenase n=1 Tax=Nonomuraea rhodomycinica TaxID=1712872 RepID=A0A7Y6IY06_9ACTN|nr:antibiotic biosynthesis monooxygenase family protein [Nonomuraea rhodomycinica]NUW46093.1 antibiotic biosynthesis monooxygenase [Nonomuraea rhodomycinica]
MPYGFVAFHYPAPEHVEEFLGRCHQVAEASRTQPGFLSVEVWTTPDADAVVTTGAFASEEAFRAAADVARELGATPDGLSDLEVRPRQVHFLVSR